MKKDDIKNTVKSLSGELAGAFTMVAGVVSGATADLYGGYLTGKTAVQKALSNVKR